MVIIFNLGEFLLVLMGVVYCLSLVILVLGLLEGLDLESGRERGFCWCFFIIFKVERDL